MNHWVTEKTIRYAVLKLVESNPGLSYTELKKLAAHKNIANPLMILAGKKQLVRKKIKRLPNPYSGIWVYFVATKQENAA